MTYQIKQYMISNSKQEINKNVKKLGILGDPNTIIKINDNSLTLGKTGIYEIDFPEGYYYYISSIESVNNITVDLVVIIEEEESL